MKAKNVKETIDKVRMHATDTGSSDVQITLLTKKIEHLSEHLKTHQKDNHSRRGLLLMVGQRKRLQTYLKRTDPKRYAKLAKTIGIK